MIAQNKENSPSENKQTKTAENKTPLTRKGIRTKAIIAIFAVATVLVPIQTQAGWKWLVETLAS